LSLLHFFCHCCIFFVIAAFFLSLLHFPVIPADAGIYLFLLTAESRPLRAISQIPELRFALSRNDKRELLRQE
jgi:hypothetical protein